MVPGVSLAVTLVVSPMVILGRLAVRDSLALVPARVRRHAAMWIAVGSVQRVRRPAVKSAVAATANVGVVNGSVPTRAMTHSRRRSAHRLPDQPRQKLLLRPRRDPRSLGPLA